MAAIYTIQYTHSTYIIKNENPRAGKLEKHERDITL